MNRHQVKSILNLDMFSGSLAIRLWSNFSCKMMEDPLHEALKMQLIIPDGGKKKSLWGIILPCERAVDTNKFCNIFEGSDTFLMYSLVGSFRPFYYLLHLVCVLWDTKGI